MVIYINVNDSETFGLTNPPTNNPTEPSVAPSFAPTGESTTTESELGSNEDVISTADSNDASQNAGATSSEELADFIYNWGILLVILLVLLCCCCFGIIFLLNRRNHNKLQKTIQTALANQSTGVVDDNDDANRLNTMANAQTLHSVSGTTNTIPMAGINTNSYRSDVTPATTGDGGAGLAIAGAVAAPAAGGDGGELGVHKNVSSYDLAIELASMPDLPAQPQVGDANGGVFGSTAGGFSAAGEYDDEDGDGINTSGGGGRVSIPGAAGEGGGGMRSGQMETGMVMNINGKKLELHKDWDAWNAKDVMIWLSMEIKNAGFEDEIGSAFMQEFKQLHMTGKVLQSWLNASNGDAMVLTKKLQAKMDFSPKSVVWDVVIQAMMNL